MNFKRYFQVLLLTVSLFLTSLPLSARSISAPTLPPSTFEPISDEKFVFGKVDEELLSEIKLLDERFEKDGAVYHDPVLDAYLNRVGLAVVADQKLENVEWKFRALRDPVPNAFALPNGSIYINTGLIALLEDENQLAAVIAHEITHVSGRHTYLRNRSLRKKVLAINIMNTIGTWNPVGGVTGLTINLIATISPFMLAISVLGYSREQEKEADLEGLKAATAAGFAPEGMPNSFKAMQRDIEGEQLNSFYSDHPKLQERVVYTSSSISADARKLSEDEAKTARSDYLALMEIVDRHNVELAINEGRFRSAVFVSQNLVTLHPDSSENLFYLAESYRMLGPRNAELTKEQLTSGAKKKAVKTRNKRTIEEQDAELLKTPAGQEAWKTNSAKAETLFLRALELNRFNASAHRGLGMLYERLNRKPEAAGEYAKYLELAPNAVDTERVRRRLTVLRDSMNN
ncbi:MAG TPA: M48 family metalloprotease [Pyrinomonadaceae bacterium]|nr:M48 family metalloprotease [Pyrinomonadaceae bacterium]